MTGINNLTEQQFLKSYDITKYDRPSVTTDIAVFSMFEKETMGHRRDSEHKLSVLLIKRGEHPYKDKWALPGGFLRSDETVEMCAMREIKEETNLSPNSIIPIGVFSNPDRDPRGRIISNSFASVISEQNVKVYGGSDAESAKWFSVDFKYNNDNYYTLLLTSDEEVITLQLKETNSAFANEKYEIISNSGLAFDHGKIIATALDTLKHQAENYDMIFSFLPDKFTLASLQRIMEILLGTSLLTANFRRKISSLVQETDEYTEGAGHRPARLFTRKD